MNRQNESKINSLLTAWPSGTVIVQTWLNRQGINRKLADVYQKHGWIERIGSGAYIRAGQKVDWLGALQAIQSQQELAIYAGGRTALELQGYAHFIPLSKRPKVFLFGSKQMRLPKWFIGKDWRVQIDFTISKVFAGCKKNGIKSYSTGAFEVNISTPERAIMEILYLTPQVHSISEAKLLMEGLTTLRKDVVQILLQSCRSVKVKRLFLFLADECNHAWAGKLNRPNINLGKGKRVIGNGGKYISKYMISVPDMINETRFFRRK